MSNKIVLRSFFRNLNLFPSESELQQILHEINLIEDVKLSFDEFVQLTNNIGSLDDISEEEEDRELKAAFKYFDRSGHGYITEIDLRKVLNSLGQYPTTSESKFHLLAK